MNDEANTHYFAMLDQLIEGHQFIENKLGWKNILFLFSVYPYSFLQEILQYKAVGLMIHLVIHQLWLIYSNVPVFNIWLSNGKF